MSMKMSETLKMKKKYHVVNKPMNNIVMAWHLMNMIYEVLPFTGKTIIIIGVIWRLKQNISTVYSDSCFR